jgi:hypothetical protein
VRFNDSVRDNGIQTSVLAGKCIGGTVLVVQSRGAFMCGMLNIDHSKANGEWGMSRSNITIIILTFFPVITMAQSSIHLQGFPSSAGNFAGQVQMNKVYVDVTAASSSTPESASFISMTSSIGSSSGNGAISAYKMGQAIQITGRPGSGNVYGQNIVVNLNPNYGAFQGSGQEININNLNHDYPFGGYGGIVTYGSQILSNSAYPITAAIAVAQIPPVGGAYAYHAGLFFSTKYGAQEFSIYDIDDALYSYNDAGSHAAAGIWEHSSAPVGVLTSNVFTTAAIQDSSMSPYGLLLKGTYANAAIYTPGIVSVGGVKLAPLTVDTLPICNGSSAGMEEYVTDAKEPTWNGKLTGGGSVPVLALCNGSAWTAH